MSLSLDDTRLSPQDLFSVVVAVAPATLPPNDPPPQESRDALFVLLPLLIVLSTFLFLLLLFLLCVVLLRRRRGISLREHDGPVDMSREDLIQGEGGFDGVESRWLESVSEPSRRGYLRAKGASLLQLSPACNLECLHDRVSTAIPTKLPADGHHTLPVPLHTGKGCLGLVV